MQPAGQPKQSKKDNKGQLAATAPTLDSLVSKRKVFLLRHIFHTQQHEINDPF